MSRYCKKFYVSGRVQGVWFRQSTVTEGRRLGLTGYVKNLQDGRVEVVACGDEDSLEELRGWLWKGPDSAHVEQIQSEELATFECNGGFSICYS